MAKIFSVTLIILVLFLSFLWLSLSGGPWVPMVAAGTMPSNDQAKGPRAIGRRIGKDRDSQKGGALFDRQN